MFSKLALFAAATFAVFVAALPGGVTNSCNGGQVYCCDQYQAASSNASEERTLLGVLVPVGVGAGLTCTPINVIAVQKQTCLSQSTCCTGNSYNGGAVVLGCNPTSASL